MTSPARPMVACSVVGANKLPASVGGSTALCAAIERAAKRSAAPRFSVEVRVLGRSRLAATLTTGRGTVLPERRFAVSDRGLNQSSIDRFARSLVAEVGKSAGRGGA